MFFGIPVSFWINLQGIYDKEIIEYKDQVEIDEDELKIIKQLKEVIKYAEKLELINKTKNDISQIIELRNICNVKNLTYINKLCTSAIAFRKSQTIETNVYVLYVWLRLCELIAEKNNVENDYNEECLKSNIEKIKKCMFLEINDAIAALTKIFAECGIVFQVVQNFAGAPVQGFIKRKDNKVILSMTIRGAFADIFWFTLFHEIGHLLNGDIGESNFIDFTNSKADIEENADYYARNALINEEDFYSLINKENITEHDIIEFSMQQEIEPFIVVGRIQKEKNDYKVFNKMKKKYIWG